MDYLRIIREIEAPENKQRKATSLMQYEIFNDRQQQYVIEYLKKQFAYQSVKEMPVITSINLARRVVKAEASLYRTPPKRTFHNMSDEQVEAFEGFYDRWGWNDKLLTANEYYKLQQQTHLYWTIKGGIIKPRVLLNHHLDAIPSREDPEVAEGYVISTFDKWQYLEYDSSMSATGFQGRSQKMSGSMADGVNQKIADPDDYRAQLEKYVFWTPDLNVKVNRDGVIESEETENPIGMLPIIDVSVSKDFEYWVRSGQAVTDFSIQFCGMLSDMANVVRMQGFGQAVFSGAEGMLPENVQIGPTFVLRLPIDPNNPVPTDFKFVTSGADIMGSLEFLKTNLSMFLSSRGLDPSTISFDGTTQSYSSGIERLLAMIQKFEASKSDMDLFEKVEHQSFDVIRAYINTYQGSDVLGPEFQIGQIPEDAYMTIEYAEPQMMQTQQEKLDFLEKKMDLGLISRVDAFKEMYGIDEEAAVKMISEIDGQNQRVNTFQE